MRRVAGDDGGAGIAAAADGVARIDGESGGNAGSGVAGVAVAGQDGADFSLEEVRFSGGELLFIGPRKASVEDDE